MYDVVGVPADLIDFVVRRAVGEELRTARVAFGWSRTQFVARLPSGIGERTLLSYEHGTRSLTVPRLIELCRALGVGAPTLLANALQRAQIHLERLSLRVELDAVVSDDTVQFRPMRQWARNRLTESPSGIAEVEPAAVRELAAFVGCGHQELARYLARFTPPSVAVEQESVVDG